jgi:CheY-like chemotaxis protein/general stress protein YciG
MKRMFEPFFTTKGRRGTGLGLAMAANVMQRLGGKISAANREGGGAVITLEFPRARRAAPPAEHDATAPLPGPVRILLVDDEVDNLEALKELLELDGHQVASATGGNEALELVRSGAHFDVVLCDLGMPDLSGWQVTERLRQLAPKIPVYLLTGWAREVRNSRPRAGVAGVLAKPIPIERLRQVIGEATRANAAPALHPPTRMADEKQGGGPKKRGFAAMDEEKQRAISRKGGESVPVEKRSFSQDRELAAQAGRKGGAARGGRGAGNNSPQGSGESEDQ